MSQIERRISCDVAVIGGGMGGVAASLAACEGGARVVLSEATDWLGGQMTSQGVSALDEHPYIERFGGTRSYERLRESIRQYYRERYGAPATMPDGMPLNPGNGWVSRLCFEPCVGLRVIEQLLAPHVESGRLTILLEHTPVAATVENDRVHDLTLRGSDGAEVIIEAQLVLDATELGDLLPLAGVEYVTGAESKADTGEPHAVPDGARPDEVQGFTYCFAIEHRPGEDHTIPRPEGYEHFREQQPYTLTLSGSHGEARPFKMFETGPTGLPPFWTYRRLFDAALLDPAGHHRDIAMINWPGNDYHWANMIDRLPEEQRRILDEAERLALGFLYWLQTEVPRDDGSGYGYPGLRLLPEVMGTTNGLSKVPYIRESRRIVARKRIVEGEIAAQGRTGARAELFHESVGIGWYHLDLHDCVGNPTSMYAPTLPFQIPLGALIPQRLGNLLAACKNIGTTHITNGAYRLHPVEWNIGESAGALAAWCVTHSCDPHDVHMDESQLRRFQHHLLVRGVPIAWTIDLRASHPLFVAAQLLLTSGAIQAGTRRDESLMIMLDAPLSHAELTGLLQAAQRLGAIMITHDVNMTHDDALVTHDEAVAVLGAIGAAYTASSEPPSWGAICAALAPLIHESCDGRDELSIPASRGEDA